MKKNLYYRQVFRRRNYIKELLLDFFLSVASMPRLLLEVFLRKNMGERYFSPFVASFVFVVFFFFPYAMGGMFGSYGDTLPEIIKDNVSWYLFLAAYAAGCFFRWQEVIRLPSVFDFARYSLSAGRIHPIFYAIRIGGKPVDKRGIEIILEPAPFFLIGLLLLWMDQRVGMLLITSSIVYSLSYIAAYHKGDDFIMDKIDEMICNEELVSAFVDELDASQTRGVHFYGHKPADPGTRRQLAKAFIEEDDLVEAR
ncbi:hypothetical protein AHMF7605_25625 [Adhaeribacter arboris]|uniref:Uncharacterized protein n=1 Tax=Adhaeribacter arboris TaxID=2072846 RepID=A0A2T2YJU5_9BACT|nr:hypothetical protein [Adhaeribacter arboris]PSR55786.1 hypothetical protein AHMF7605_20930 [Adhaeribacter arboris]PSR56632.1 hypothetical protein AHMF7605_25625 [Adhaeribacter arboris]